MIANEGITCQEMKESRASRKKLRPGEIKKIIEIKCLVLLEAVPAIERSTIVDRC